MHIFALLKESGEEGVPVRRVWRRVSGMAPFAADGQYPALPTEGEHQLPAGDRPEGRGQGLACRSDLHYLLGGDPKETQRRLIGDGGPQTTITPRSPNPLQSQPSPLPTNPNTRDAAEGGP